LKKFGFVFEQFSITNDFNFEKRNQKRMNNDRPKAQK
jgi:hypothetical protein